MQVLLRGLNLKVSDSVDQGIQLLALQFQILFSDDRYLRSQEFHPLFHIEHLLLWVEPLLDFLPQLLFYLLVRRLFLVLVPVPNALEAPDRDLGLLLPLRRLFGFILEILDFEFLFVSLRLLFFASNLNLSMALIFHFFPILSFQLSQTIKTLRFG
jgi:hypothetical protein